MGLTFEAKTLAVRAGRALALPVLISLYVAACTLTPQTAGRPSAGEAAPRPASKPKEAVEPAVDSRAAPSQERPTKSDAPVLARRTAVRPESKPAPRSELPPLPLKSLIGLDQNAASALVGQPSTVAEKPPAIIWEYRDATCALKLNFFFEVQQKSYRVLTVKVEGTDGSELADQACLDTIRDRKLTQN